MNIQKTMLNQQYFGHADLISLPSKERRRYRRLSRRSSPLPSRERVRGVLLGTAVTAVLLLLASWVHADPLDDMLAKRKPDATIDLANKEGAQLVKGEWRYSDTKIIEVDFTAAGADGQPGNVPSRAYDFTPHAGGADFDDSKWEVIDPATLDKRRSAGRLAFNWYRIKITVPKRIG